MKKSRAILVGAFLALLTGFFAMTPQILRSGLLSQAQMANQQTENDRAPRSRLGIQGVPCYLITNIEPGSSVAQAGLRPGDIITHLNGEQLVNVEMFQEKITTSAPGTSFEITYLRFNPTTGSSEERRATVSTRPLRTS